MSGEKGAYSAAPFSVTQRISNCESEANVSVAMRPAAPLRPKRTYACACTPHGALTNAATAVTMAQLSNVARTAGRMFQFLKKTLAFRANFGYTL